MLELNPQKTSLIVIDMQKDFYGKDGSAAKRGKKVSQMQNLVKPINNFTNHLRNKKCSIIFTKFISSPDITPENLREVGKKNQYSHSCLKDSGGENLEGVTVKDNDIVIEKLHYDAFAYTNLKKILEDKNIENVIICGVRTEICVDATAKRSASEGFRTIIAKDLIGTYDNKNHYNSELIGFFDNYYGYSIISGEIIKSLN